MENINLIAFKAISDFTKDLDEIFGKEHKPLALYARLIAKTTLSHAEAIDKHISSFRAFCVTNRDQILEKNTELSNPSISYSTRVYINMAHIFKIADAETRDTIWRHILSISALVDPANASKVKDVLRNSDIALPASGEDASVEDDFLNKIIERVGESVKPDADPNEAISSILSSGLIPDLVSSLNSGISNGTLDLGKMMGTVNKMMSSMNTEGVNMAGMPDIMGMMSQLGGLGALGGSK